MCRVERQLVITVRFPLFLRGPAGGQPHWITQELVGMTLPQLKKLTTWSEVLERVYPFLGFYFLVVEIFWSHVIGGQVSHVTPKKIAEPDPHFLFGFAQGSLLDCFGPHSVEVPVENSQPLLKIPEKVCSIYRQFPRPRGEL